MLQRRYEPSFDSDKIVSIVTMLFKGILPIAFILILHSHRRTLTPAIP